MGPKLQAALHRHGLAEHYAMRVADRDEDALTASPRRVEMYSFGLSVKPRRQVRGSKRSPADVELRSDLGAVPRKHADWILAPDRGQLEQVAGAMLEHRVGRCDSQPVAAFLGLRTVRVEDADRHPRRVERQQAVGAKPQVAVAQSRQERD